jgi:hypothetical protein
MTWDEAFALPRDASVRCLDGTFGEVVRWDEARQILGIRVVGEGGIRLVPVKSLLHLGRGTVIEIRL